MRPLTTEHTEDTENLPAAPVAPDALFTVTLVAPPFQ